MKNYLKKQYYFYCLLFIASITSCNKLHYKKDVLKDGLEVQMKPTSRQDRDQDQESISFKRSNNNFSEEKKNRFSDSPKILRPSFLDKTTRDTGSKYYNKQYEDPTKDLAFKFLLGDMNRKDLLIDLLNSLLNLKGKDEIKEINFEKGELVKKNVALGSNYLDVFCTSKKGERFLVEMQALVNQSFLVRSQVYISRVIADQYRGGKEYEKDIQRVYIVVIAKRIQDNLRLIFNDRFSNDFAIRDSQGNMLYNNKMFWYFFDLEKFKKKFEEEFEEEFEVNYKDQWLYFFATCGKEEKKPQFITHKPVEDSYIFMHQLLWDVDTARAYKTAEENYERQKQKHINLGRQRGQAEKEIKAYQNQYKNNNAISYEGFKNSYKNFLGESPKFFKPRHVEKIQNKIQGESSEWNDWTQWKPENIFDGLNTNSQPFFSQYPSQRIYEEDNNFQAEDFNSRMANSIQKKNNTNSPFLNNSYQGGMPKIGGGDHNFSKPKKNKNRKSEEIED